jgi:hypothetical protein
MATMTLDKLVEQLRAADAQRLRAVVLYGSAAAGEHIKNRSDYNVLVIVESLPLSGLHALSAVVRAWTDAGNPPPLIFTVDEWRGSADIFPMEYADILERHRVLHGEPPFDGISVRPADLRLQVEHEAMGKLLQLRRSVLASGGDAKRQLELLEASLSTLMVIFRGIVRLNGSVPPTDNERLARDVASFVGFDPEPFAQVIHHVRGTKRLSASEAGGVLAGYLGGMQALVAYLDRYSPSTDEAR